MAAIRTYDYMSDGNLAPSMKLKYLVLESRQIRKLSDMNEVNIDDVLKLKNHLYNFINNSYFHQIVDNKFNTQCMIELQNHIISLETNIDCNMEQIMGNKLQQFIMLDRPYEKYIEDLHYYERKLNSILKWIDIPVMKLLDNIIACKYVDDCVDDINLISSDTNYIECDLGNITL